MIAWGLVFVLPELPSPAKPGGQIGGVSVCCSSSAYVSYVSYELIAFETRSFPVAQMAYHHWLERR